MDGSREGPMLPYAITIALGAFLLFLVQPVMGRYLLPWFGGGPSVWNTCMVFFQVALLAGYAYAHLISRCLRPARQAAVHVVLLGVCLLYLPAAPVEAWRPQPGVAPAAGILLVLAGTVGLPYLMLSSTGPLLQAWFCRSHPGQSPYRLYSLSNLASLAALLSYPLVIEPAMGLRWQSWIWSAMFVAYAAGSAWCARRSAAAQHAAAVKAARAETAEPASPLDGAMWFLFAACASAMLLATNNQISQDLPAVPMLWILPLTLYLLSFILCFHSLKWCWRPLWLTLAVPALAGVMLVSSEMRPHSLPAQLAIYCGALMVCCMVCHGELVRLKPPPQRLTGFYLVVSAGGAAGSVLVSLVAPVVFNDYWEYPLTVAACILLVLVQWYRRCERVRPMAAVVGGAVGVAVAVALGFHLTVKEAGALERSRNFFGVLQVRRGGVPGTFSASRMLVHGRIVHGEQLTSHLLRRMPVSYYGPQSGVGLAQAALRRQREATGRAPNLRIGVVGLGAGVVAAYGREGDYLRFYEINPDVVALSDRHFTYRRDTPAACDLVLGDARLSMAQARRRGDRGNFDLMVLDAFSGDSIPLHLLTREAFDEYWAQMADDGVLAVHISNLYIDLRPVVLAAAQARGAHAFLVEDWEAGRPALSDSRWVLVTMNQRLAADRQIASAAVRLEAQCRPTLFTDDYSNIARLVTLE